MPASIEPPFLPIDRAANDVCRSLYWRSTAQTPPRGIHRWLTAGARVPPRCSKHRGRLVAPGGLPYSTRPTSRSRSEGYRGGDRYAGQPRSVNPLTHGEPTASSIGGDGRRQAIGKLVGDIPGETPCWQDAAARQPAGGDRARRAPAYGARRPPRAESSAPRSTPTPGQGAACETPGACGLAQPSILLVNTHLPWIADWMPLWRTGGTPRGESRAVSTCCRPSVGTPVGD